MIGVEPSGDSRNPAEIRCRANAATQVADIDAVPLLLPGGVIPQSPDFETASEVLLVTFGCRRIGQLPALFAIASRRSSGARPSVREKSVDVITRTHFTKNRRHLLGEIRGVHTGLIKPRRFQVDDRLPIAGPLNPLRMGIVSLFVDVVAIHAGYDPDMRGLGGLGEIAEQIANRPETGYGGDREFVSGKTP